MKTSDIVWQDTQHQELLDTIDALKSSPEIGAELMDKLSGYIAHHFSLEEKYMALTAYPDSQRHIALHRRFEDKVKKLNMSKNIVTEGFQDDEFRMHVSEFLNGWLMDHLMGIDKELEAHILNSDIK